MDRTLNRLPVWWVSNKKNRVLNCFMGFVETKKQYVYSGELLAWNGTSDGHDREDAEKMETTNQGGELEGDGQIRWGARTMRSKESEDWLDGELNLSVRSIPKGLERCNF